MHNMLNKSRFFVKVCDTCQRIKAKNMEIDHTIWEYLLNTINLWTTFYKYKHIKLSLVI